MKWTDVRDIAFALLEAHPEVDPLTLQFTELHAWVLKLPGFVGKPEESNEKILEAIQMAWIDER
jgi:FeS assembly protein IscX